MHFQIPAVAITVSLFAGIAPVFGQGLADLANKAEESRKAAKKQTKIYTNADAGNMLAATAASPSDKAATPAPAAGDAAGQTVQPPAAEGGQEPGSQKTQAYWAEKQKSLQGQLERDTVFAEAIQTRINILSADLINNDQGQRPAIEQDRNRALAELARLQKAIAADRKAMADFEDEARRSSVPPGWLR